MTVYVRLVNGAEDKFPSYEGCERCGCEESTGSRYQTRCAECAHSKNIDNREYFMPRANWNVRVDTPSDGTLVISKRKSRVAFYPAGSWISWRSD